MDICDYPVSYVQERLWFMDQLSPRQATYNMAAAVGLSGWLEEGALRWGLAEIVQRYEVLRKSRLAERRAKLTAAQQALFQERLRGK